MGSKASKKSVWSVLATLLVLILSFFGINLGDDGGTVEPPSQPDMAVEDFVSSAVTYGEDYRSAEDVAAYLFEYEELPPNYLTKREAADRGWVAEQGNLDDVAPGASIGGDRFYNYEGQLPEKSGRQYYEADVNYKGGFRGPERLVFSNDGLIYYTDDHYDSFVLLNHKE